MNNKNKMMDQKQKNKPLAGLDKTKSFKAKKKIQKGTRGYQLK